MGTILRILRDLKIDEWKKVIILLNFTADSERKKRKFPFTGLPHVKSINFFFFFYKLEKYSPLNIGTRVYFLAEEWK